MPTISCDIVCPTKHLASVEAYMVVVPGSEGSLGFLPGHEPLLTPLKSGVVSLQDKAGSLLEQFVVQGGYAEMAQSKLIILADKAANVKDLDRATLEAQLSELQAKHDSQQELDSHDAQSYELAVSWIKLCLEHC